MATWVDLAPATQPTERYDVGMDWDRANGNLVMFGGQPANAQTWLWDGTTWTQASPAHSPDARETRNMIAWDGTKIVHQHVQAPQETWSWDGADWTQLSPGSQPGTRNGVQMAWTGDYVLAFGGQAAGPTLLDETWIWDGSDWTQLFPANSPEPSSTGVLASDAAGETIYFGDNGMSGYENHTYRWDPDAVDWVLLSPTSEPPGRINASFAYGGATNGLVLFGGQDPTLLADTWIWRDNDWCECSPDDSPTARVLAALGYTPAGPVLFGKSFPAAPPASDTWRLSGACCPSALPQAGISHRFGLG